MKQDSIKKLDFCKLVYKWIPSLSVRECAFTHENVHGNSVYLNTHTPAAVYHRQ